MPNGSQHEGDLHLFGKMCFEMAAGKRITLPKPDSPRFDPPKEFAVQAVEFEKAISWAGHRGRRPDVVLTNEMGHRLIVEIKDSSSKSVTYGNDMSAVGLSLVLELDVSRWRDRQDLRPDFTQGDPLQFVVDQTKWIACGRPSVMEWRPYGLVAYSCNNTRCDDCHTFRGGDRIIGWSMESLRIFYGCPRRTLSELAKHTGKQKKEAREEVYKALRCLRIECEHVSLVERHSSENGVGRITDRAPDKVWRETGWVLHRDGNPLEQYRVRAPAGGGFQAIVYEHGFIPKSLKDGPPSRRPFAEFVTYQRNASLFPVRTLWKDAIRDLFSRLAPHADSQSFCNRNGW